MENLKFFGDTYDYEQDYQRLKGNVKKIYPHLLTGEWINTNELAEKLDIPHSSLTACIRGLRHPENGRHPIVTERRGHESGTFDVRLLLDKEERIQWHKDNPYKRKARRKDIEEIHHYILCKALSVSDDIPQDTQDTLNHISEILKGIE